MTNWQENLEAKDVALLFNKIVPNAIHLEARGERLETKNRILHVGNQLPGVIQRRRLQDVFEDEKINFHQDGKGITEDGVSTHNSPVRYLLVSDFNIPELLKLNHITKKSELDILRMSQALDEIKAVAEPFKNDPAFQLAATSVITQLTPSAIKQGALAALVDKSILKRVEDLIAGTQSQEHAR